MLQYSRSPLDFGGKDFRRKSSGKRGQKGNAHRFRRPEKAVRSLADAYDHALIYETGSLKPTTLAALQEENFHLIEVPFRPTAENFAKYFYDKLAESGICAASVTVYETPKTALFTRWKNERVCSCREVRQH